MCKKLIYLISVLLLALCLMPSAQAANITLVTETQDYDADGIQDDQQLIDWLVAEGHVVDLQPDYWIAFGRTTPAELNRADLIIVSRSTSSGNYADEDEPTKWNSLTSPLILMNAYVVRNTRWLWFDSGSTLGDGGAPMLEAVDPGHPIFTNVPLNASNQVQVLDPAIGSGNTSFIDAADMGNGTLIAQTVDGLPWIVEWDAGVEFYAGAGQVPAGKRMMFAAGTQETDEPLTPWGAFNLTAEGEILLRNAISYMLGERIAVIEPEPPALVAHWKFDDGEGTVAVDSSGNGNDGILNGDPQWVEGKIGGALEFNGDDYVNCGNGPSLQLQDAITMAFWFKVEAFQNTWEAFMAKGDDSYRTSRGGGTGDATHMGISGTSVGGGNGWFNGTVIVTGGQWHHMAATYDGAEGRIYIDGVLDVTSPGTGQINISNYDFWIGNNSQQTGRFFHGLLDDVRIYDGALTEEQIQAVMMPIPEPVDPGTEGLLARWPCDEGEGAVVSDASGNGRDGTFVFGDPAWVEGNRGSAVELIGPTLIEVPPLDVELTEATMAGWILPYGPQPDWSSIIMTRTPGLATGFNVLGYQLAYHWNDTSDSWSFRGGDMIAEDDWTFAAVTIEPDKATFYVNGKAGSVNEITHGPCLWNSNIYLGGDGNDNWIARRMIGALDDVLIYDRALSEAEVMYLAGKRATPVDPGTEGLVAHYAFENNADESSGNELHGTLVGDPTFAEGPAGYGMALDLDGDGDYVDCGAPPQFDITEQIAITYWIKVVAFDKGWNTVLSRGDDSWRSSRAGTNNFMEAAVSGTTGDWTYGVTPVDDDKWHHVAWVYDGTMNYLYVDGEVDATEESTGLINVSTYPLFIGNNSQNTDREWTGLIDEVSIYNRSLSAGEVRYLAGFRPMVDPGTDNLIAYYPLDIDTLDASGNGNDGTVNGDPIFVDGVVGTAMEFDGAGDFLDCGNNPILALTDAVSISAWIKVAVLGADHKVGGNQDGANGGYKMSVYNDKIEFEIRTSGNSAVLNRSVAGGTLLDVGVWYHVVGVYSLADGYIRTYVDGKLDRELLTTEALGASPGALMIGCEPFSTGQYNFNGVMDDIRVYNKALSEDEARYLANN
ncbi:MAG: LamG domain-containing protein [Phycisphaerae bacterium]